MKKFSYTWRTEPMIKRTRDDYRTYEEAQQYIKENNITRKQHWLTQAREEILPPDLPKRPHLIYAREWNGWDSFLGNGSQQDVADETSTKKLKPKKAETKITPAVVDKAPKISTAGNELIMFVIHEKALPTTILTIGIEHRGMEFIADQKKNPDLTIYRLYKYNSAKATYVQSMIGNLTSPYDENVHRRHAPVISDFLKNLDIQLEQLAI